MADDELSAGGGDVADRMEKVLREVLDPPADTDVTAADFKRGEAPGWDSVSHMRLIAAVEKEFNTQLQIDDVLKLETHAAGVELLAEGSGR